MAIGMKKEKLSITPKGKPDRNYGTNRALQKQKNTLLEMRTDGEISKEEYKEQKEKIEMALLDITEEYDRMLAAEETVQNPDICWDEIKSSLETMIDFSNPQIDHRIIKKFVPKIVPNGRNYFR